MSNPFEPLPLDEQWSPERAISEDDWRMAVDAFQATDDDYTTDPEEIRKARGNILSTASGMPNTTDCSRVTQSKCTSSSAI